MRQIASLTRLFIAAAVSFTMTALTTSCGDDDDEPGDFIKITNRTSNQLMYSYPEQSVDDAIAISTGGAWQATVTEGSDWLSLRGTTSSTTKGQYSFGLQLTQNYGKSERNGEILITSGTESQTIYIIQDYNPSANNTSDANYSKHNIQFTLTATNASKTIGQFAFGGESFIYGYTLNGGGNVRKVNFYAKNASTWIDKDFNVKDRDLGIDTSLKLADSNVTNYTEFAYYSYAIISCTDDLLPDEEIHITFELFGKLY